MNEQNSLEVEVAAAWQGAANQNNIGRLLELSDLNIEIIGPRGSGFGHQLLRDWLARAGLTLETRQIFVDKEIVVFSQHGVWREPGINQITGEKDLASRFKVINGRVTTYARYDSLEEALASAGLTRANLFP